MTERWEEPDYLDIAIAEIGDFADMIDGSAALTEKQREYVLARLDIAVDVLSAARTALNAATERA